MQIFKAKVFYFFILITTVSCTSTAEVFFQDVVDTSDKEIKFQEKKIFSFDKSGVYFSNDFDGARLNNVIQKNDSTFILSVYLKIFLLIKVNIMLLKLLVTQQKELILNLITHMVINIGIFLKFILKINGQ